MDILNLIKEQIGDKEISELSNQIGGSKEETSKAMESALPTILSALSRKGNNPQQAGGILSLLDQNGDGNPLDDLMGFFKQGNDTHGGGSIVDTLFGNKKSKVEQHIAQDSGLSQDATSNLMKQLGPVVMNLLNKKKSEQGMDINDLFSMVTNQAKQQEGGQNSMIANLLDKDGDGDMQDDLMDMGKKMLGNFFKRK